MTDWVSQAKPGQHTLSEFRFDDGRRLDVTLAYHTLGSLDARADNAVMLLHGTTGSGRQFLQPSIADFLFHSGQPPRRKQVLRDLARRHWSRGVEQAQQRAGA